MDNALTTRAIVIGHLTLTMPAVAGILLVPFLGLRMFGPFLFYYYFLAGIAVASQWHSVALPSWEKWLAGKGVPQQEVENLAHRSGLAWPGVTGIGLFALHTAAAATCGIHFGPWLLSRWYAWVLPLTGMAHYAPTGNDWLQHFELVSIVPALLVGYILSRYFRGMATWAWILPTIALAYKLFTFTEPYSSVLGPRSSIRFSYFFDIQRSLPTFFGGGDPLRVAEQINVVAPFYAGVAYSIGAFASRQNLLEKLLRHFRGAQPEPELVLAETSNGHAEDGAEKPSQLL